MYDMCKRRMLTYHVSLLMHHHPQVLEDVIDICDVGLNQGTFGQIDHVRMGT